MAGAALLPQRMTLLPLRNTAPIASTTICSSSSIRTFPSPLQKIHRPSNQPFIQLRSKQTATSVNFVKKRDLSRGISQNKAKRISEEPVDSIYGMRPIDYSTPPPIRGSPPPPPPKPGMRKYIFPLSVVATLGITGYFYVNNKNDNLEFWSAMQEGKALQMVDDDDDDDYEEDED